MNWQDLDFEITPLKLAACGIALVAISIAIQVSLVAATVFIGIALMATALIWAMFQ